MTAVSFTGSIDSSVLPVGPAGPPGPTGLTGPAGSPGAPGATVAQLTANAAFVSAVATAVAAILGTTPAPAPTPAPTPTPATGIQATALPNGWDGVIALQGKVFVNGHGKPIKLKGINLPMDSQELGGTATQAYWDKNPGGVYFGADGPPPSVLKSTGANVARITMNSALFLQLPQGLIGGTPSAPTFTGSVAVDVNNVYKPLLLKLMISCRAAGMYIIPELHWDGATVTLSGKQGNLPAWDQPAFCSDNATAFWAAFIKFAATNFGSAAFNAKLGVNGGAAGAHYDPNIGGASGINDLLPELFNEPYTSGLQGAIFSSDAAQTQHITYQQFLGQGGYCNKWADQNQSATGVGGIGIPASVRDGMYLDVIWHSPGYNGLISTIRGLGFTGPLGCNTDSWAHRLPDWAAMGIADPLNQVWTGYHVYEYGTSGWAYAQDAQPDSSGDADGQPSCYNYLPLCPVAILITENGATNGAGVGAKDSGFLTNLHAMVDKAPVGTIGALSWVWMPSNTGSTVQEYMDACYSANIPVTATVSGATFTLQADAPGFDVGSVLMAGSGNVVWNNSAFDRPYAAALVSGVTGKAGAVYTLSSPSPAGATTSWTAANIIPMPLQGTQNWAWMAVPQAS